MKLALWMLFSPFGAIRRSVRLARRVRGLAAWLALATYSCAGTQAQEATVARTDSPARPAIFGGTSRSSVDRYHSDCKRGDGRACVVLGTAYLGGAAGVAQDAAKAAQLFDKACRLGDAAGCGRFASALMEGRGVGVDRDAGRALFKKACELGEQQACDLVRKLLPIGFEATVAACERGDQEACARRDATAQALVARDNGERKAVWDPNAVYHVPIGRSAQKGAEDALVTLVVFGDFQCPFTARLNDTLAVLHAAYGRDLRIVFKHHPLPFHSDAMLAAEAALEAREQGRFWDYKDRLFAHQDALARSDLERYARELDLDMTALGHALDDHTHRSEVEADTVLARSLDANATPAFYVNGRFLRGAQPIEVIAAMIDEERERAGALLRKGIPPKELYATLIANGARTGQFLDKPVEARPKPSQIYDLAEPRHPRSRGRADGPVVIQEFGDFQCPFTKRAQATVDALLEEYGDQIRLVWRDSPLPFHDDAFIAAEAAREVFRQAGQAAFWKYHDRLFVGQGALDRENLERWAEELVPSLDLVQFRRALDRGVHRAAIEADMRAVEAAGAQIVTPSFFVNGVQILGAQPKAVFEQAIDQALRDGPRAPTPLAEIEKANAADTASHPKLPSGRALRELACSRGAAIACFQLGLDHLSDEGSRRSAQRAAAMFRKACDGGHAIACHHLSQQYSDGNGVSKSEKKAFALDQRACTKGHALSCFNVGVAYGQGLGTRKSREKSEAMFAKACAMGFSDGCPRDAYQPVLQWSNRPTPLSEPPPLSPPLQERTDDLEDFLK